MRDERLADFRVFIQMVWKFKGLPEPSVGQYEIADIIQNVVKHAGLIPLDPDPTFLDRYPMLRLDNGKCADRVILQVYRGFGKSVICSCGADWVQYWNERLLNLCVSGSEAKAKEFTHYAFSLLHELPPLSHMVPEVGSRKRSSTMSFDIEGATEQAPSTRAGTIMGTLVGGRADVAWMDDVETPNNSSTLNARDTLRHRTSEIGGAILKPGGVAFVPSTPQCEETVYGVFERERGYVRIVLPSRYPSDDWIAEEGGCVLPRILREIEEKGPSCQTGGGLDGTLGQPTDPERFGEEQLQKYEMEWGRSGFMLQYQLDTRMTDALRYPLKLHEILVTEIDLETGPERLVRAKNRDRVWTDLPVPPMRGSKFYAPYFESEVRLPYSGCVMAIDPAGRGADEMSWVVLRELNGFLFLTSAGGLVGGYGEENLVTLAQIAKDQGVNEIVTEPNFGDGMFDSLLAPVLREHYPCPITEGPRATVQKEKRIIDTIEPVLNAGLLVVDPQVILDDVKPHKGEAPQLTQQRSLFYQMAFLTREKGSLRHDDRIDALSIAVGYWQNALGADIERRAIKRKEDRLRDMSLNRYRKARALNKPHARTTWIDGVR